MPSSTLVVGANRGIGLALVHALRAADSEGVVYATTRSPSDALNALAKESNGKVVVLEGVDTADTDKLKAAAEQLRKHTDSIDVIYNNAGQSHGGGPITGVTAQQLRDNFEGNVVGPHNILLEFSPFVLASKAEKRSIVITSSVLGSINSIPFIKEWAKGAGLPGLVTGAYGTSKTAVNMLGRYWGEALEPQGVSVLLIHPGYVATDMAGKDAKGAITPEESATSILKLTASFNPSETAKGVYSYDGQVFGW